MGGADDSSPCFFDFCPSAFFEPSGPASTIDFIADFLPWSAATCATKAAMDCPTSSGTGTVHSGLLDMSLNAFPAASINAFALTLS